MSALSASSVRQGGGGPQCANASWCSFPGAGRRVVSGTTSAHRSPPFGSGVRVSDLGNGKVIAVWVNDRGLLVQGRGSDVSTAHRLGMRSGATCMRLAVDQHSRSPPWLPLAIKRYPLSGPCPSGFRAFHVLTRQGGNREIHCETRPSPRGELDFAIISGRSMVGVAGFEPATPSSRTRCATRLRYTP